MPPMQIKPGLLATLVGLVGNTLLCILKLGVGFWSASLSLLSDGVNSLTDVVSSVAIFFAVRVSAQEADEGHPFGHHRAEPIAGLIVAIFAGIAGFEILREAVARLVGGSPPQVWGVWPFLVLAFSVTLKASMASFFQRIGEQINSPAILAGAADSRNDVLISLTALGGVTGSWLGWSWLDPGAAVAISVAIFRTGYRIGRDNIDYLMGRSPSPEMIDQLRAAIGETPAVGTIDRLQAHYVGNYLHVEIEICPDRQLSAGETHDLEERLRARVEQIPAIDRAFVHVNPA